MDDDIVSRLRAPRTTVGCGVDPEEAAREIERLRLQTGALAWLHYGSRGPDDPWQRAMDEATKPLHTEIERLRKLLKDVSDEISEPTYVSSTGDYCEVQITSSMLYALRDAVKHHSASTNSSKPA